MGIEQLSNEEFDDTFDIERIKKELENLSKKKNLKEQNDKLVKEFMEYQSKNALKGNDNGKE